MGTFLLCWLVLILAAWSSDQPVGVVLEYEIDGLEIEAAEEVDADQVLRIVRGRVGRAGTVERTDEGAIKVGVYGSDAESVERLKAMLAQNGKLEFRIVANTRDHAELIDVAEQAKFKNVKELKQPNDQGKDEVIAKWVLVVPEEAERFRTNPNYAVRENKKREVEVLVVIDRYNVTGDNLAEAWTGFDQFGKPCVNFRLNATGARRFGKLTAENLPDLIEGFERQLAIVLDEYVQSAPSIRGRIEDRGEITGTFTEQQVEDMAAVLNVGALPATLRLVRESQADSP